MRVAKCLMIAAIVAASAWVHAEGATGNVESAAVVPVRPHFSGTVRSPDGVLAIRPNGEMLVVGDTVTVTTPRAVFTWEIVAIELGKEPKLQLKDSEITFVAPVRKVRLRRDPSGRWVTSRSHDACLLVLDAAAP